MTALAIALLTATTVAASGLAWWAYCNWRATQSLCRSWEGLCELANDRSELWHELAEKSAAKLAHLTAQRQAAARKGWQTRRRA